MIPEIAKSKIHSEKKFVRAEVDVVFVKL